MGPRIKAGKRGARARDHIRRQSGGRSTKRLTVIEGSSLRLDQPKSLQVTKTLTTSPLNESDNFILDREEPTGESVGSP